MSSIIQYSGMVQRPGGSDRYNAGTSRGEQKNEEKKELVSQESTTSSIGHIAADPSYYTATGRQSKPYSSASAFSNPCKKRVSTSSLQPPESQNLVDKDLLVDQQQCSTHSVYGRQDQARGEQQRQQQQQQEMVEVSIERLRQYHTGTNKCRYHGYATKRLPYGNLGKSGLRVSSIGLGTWVTFGSQISEEVAEEMVTLAYESGINFFDTAEVYAGGKAEVILGNIFKNKGWRRSSYIISTKLYVGGKAETEKGLSRKHIIEGLQASLSRLQMQYVDLVFANKPDPHTPMEEIVRAFTHVINLGWAMYWGTSRWSPMEIMEAYSVARQFNLIPPIAEQAEYNLFQREKVEIQMPELFQKIGLGCITWSPMACGALTGKYEDGVPPQSRAALKGYNWLKDKILSEEGRRHQQKLRELTPLAERLGCTLAQLAIAWCLKNDNVHCVLLGATTVDQLYENLQSLQVVPKLNILYMNEIDRILGNKPVAHGLSNQR